MLLNTLAAASWIAVPIIFGPILWVVGIYALYHFALAKYLMVLYVIWMYIDRDSCERGGRRWDPCRRLKWWQYLRDYFPITLVKTAELPADKNYLLAIFPHGILPYGGFATFGTDVMHFEKRFPGIRTYYCTLKMNFFMPCIREFGNLHGFISVSQESINWVLSHPVKGKAVAVVVGGASEALCNRPGEYKIYLKNRKGFCRIALQNGSPLVPVYVFGETELYQQWSPKEGSAFDIFQRWVKKVTGIAPIVFFSDRGLIPRKVPITVTVGEPINVQLVKNPTKEDIDGLHQKFMDSITELFNAEKHKYISNPDAKLEII